MKKRMTIATTLLMILLPACSTEDTARTARGATSGPRTIRLLTHDSFALPDELLNNFSESTGITVKITRAGDAGSMLNTLILNDDRAIADVVYGIDNTFASRAIDAKVLEPYRTSLRSELQDSLRTDQAPHLTPIDTADVCVDVDRAWFDAHPEIPIPTNMEDLTNPIYRNLFVVQDPARSSPGAAFLFATILRYGDSGWETYWEQLVDNGVAVTSGWEEAYNTRFTGSGAAGADRPIVVSYATDPAAAIIFGDGSQPTTSPIGVLADTCYHQIEYAGVVRGTQQAAAAETFIDFLLSVEVQAALPENMFVLPARSGIPLPAVFQKYYVPVPEQTLSPSDIAKHRSDWIATWTEIAL